MRYYLPAIIAAAAFAGHLRSAVKNDGLPEQPTIYAFAVFCYMAYRLAFIASLIPLDQLRSSDAIMYCVAAPLFGTGALILGASWRISEGAKPGERKRILANSPLILTMFPSMVLGISTSIRLWWYPVPQLTYAFTVAECGLSLIGYAMFSTRFKQFQNNRMRVELADGSTGTIGREEFDPKTMKQL